MNFDLHRATGIYAALFLLLTASTGTAFVFNETAIDLVDAVTASPPRVEPARTGIPAHSLDTLLHQADRVLPAPTTWISLPQTPQAPLVVRKKLPQELHPNGRNFLYLNQHSGRVLQAKHALSAPLSARIFNTLYPTTHRRNQRTPTRVLLVIVGLAPTPAGHRLVTWITTAKGNVSLEARLPKSI
ncbi:MAG: hypothetical protein ABS89_05550 [Thiobacillus sp. SCN 63-1177]|nr:MAG: hypothetical protein ABS89_05550 [Thiobacillus sp. SCN 63-1177]